MAEKIIIDNKQQRIARSSVSQADTSAIGNANATLGATIATTGMALAQSLEGDEVANAKLRLSMQKEMNDEVRKDNKNVANMVLQKIAAEAQRISNSASYKQTPETESLGAIHARNYFVEAVAAANLPEVSPADIKSVMDSLDKNVESMKVWSALPSADGGKTIPYRNTVTGATQQISTGDYGVVLEDSMKKVSPQKTAQLQLIRQDMAAVNFRGPEYARLKDKERLLFNSIAAETQIEADKERRFNEQIREDTLTKNTQDYLTKEASEIRAESQEARAATQSVEATEAHLSQQEARKVALETARIALDDQKREAGIKRAQDASKSVKLASSRKVSAIWDYIRAHPEDKDIMNLINAEKNNVIMALRNAAGGQEDPKDRAEIEADFVIFEDLFAGKYSEGETKRLQLQSKLRENKLIMNMTDEEFGQYFIASKVMDSLVLDALGKSGQEPQLVRAAMRAAQGTSVGYADSFVKSYGYTRWKNSSDKTGIKGQGEVEKLVDEHLLKSLKIVNDSPVMTYEYVSKLANTPEFKEAVMESDASKARVLQLADVMQNSLDTISNGDAKLATATQELIKKLKDMAATKEPTPKAE